MRKPPIPFSSNPSQTTDSERKLFPELVNELTPWLAMSLLQKAIRRNNRELAHLAAASLLLSDPERLRRRIAVILFEDIGIGSPDTIASVLPTVTRQGWTLHRPEGWRAVPSLLDQMCESPKCRAVDDLLVMIGWDPGLEELKRDFGSLNPDHLVQRFYSSADVIERAIVLLHLIGNLRSQENFPSAKPLGSKAVWNLLLEMGCSANLVTLARQGKTAGAREMPLIFALLSLYNEQHLTSRSSDTFPPESLISGTPGWVYDVHVRQGNQALSAFLRTDALSAQLVMKHGPANGKAAFLGGLLFRIESGLVTNRLQWALGTNFRSRADFHVHGVEPEIALQISQQLTRDIPLLDEVRQHVIKSNPR